MSNRYSPSPRLNPAQITLLRLFDRGMSDEDVLAFKRLPVQHYGALLQEEVTRVVEEKGYTAEEYEAMLNGESPLKPDRYYGNLTEKN